MIENRQTLNRYLGVHGLSTLDDPQGLCAQLGFLVEDHAHFRSLINKCLPEYRADMYEALRPHLSFTPRPLDVYIAELGQQAEAEQLPTVDLEGKFHAYRVAEIRSLAEADDEIERSQQESAEEAEDLYRLRSTIEGLVGQQLSKHHLTLTCRSCTREETFHGGTKGDAIWKARKAGWTYGLDKTGQGKEICPDCPATRKN